MILALGRGRASLEMRQFRNDEGSSCFGSLELEMPKGFSLELPTSR